MPPIPYADAQHVETLERFSFRRDSSWIAAVALGYFVVARLSLFLVVEPAGIAAIWPPSGIFLAALLLARRESRPWLAGTLFITDFVAELLTGTPPVLSGVYAVTLTADAALSVWLLHRFVGERITLSRVREVIGWLLLSVVFSNAMLSLVAASAAQTLPDPGTFWSSWQWWATSDGVGNLVVTPLVVTWASRLHVRGGSRPRVHGAEEAVLFVGSGLVTWLLFLEMGQAPLLMLGLPYLTFPFLVWAALRVGERGVATVVFVFAPIAVSFVAAGRVPSFSFQPGALDEVLVVQLLLASSAIPALILGAVVTERRDARIAEEKAAQAVRESQAILRSVIDGTTDAVFVKDTRGRYLMLNEAVCRFVGKSAEELLGQDDITFFPPAEAQGVMERDRAVMASGVTRTYEEAVTVEGAPHTFLATKGPVRDERGNVIGLFGISRDITERKRVEEELRENEEKYRSLFNNAEVGMFRTRVDGSEILDCNEKYLEIFGYSREEMLSSPATVHWADPHEREEMVGSLKADGRVKNFECGMLNKHGEVRRCLTSLRLYPAQGILEGSILDITDRKRAEEAVRESEVRLRDIMTSMGDWVWEVDAGGVYTYSSPRGEALFGDVIGKTPFDLMRPAEAGRVEAIFRDIAARKAPIRNLGNWNITKDGEDIFLLTNGVPIIDAEGRLLGYRGVDKDITDRARAEEERARLDAQLQQAHKMESVGRLAGGVAHDFNNMLGVIIGNAEEVLGRIDPTDPIHSGVEEIRRAAVRSADLTRQLLAFARRQTVEPKVLDLNETVGGMLKMLRRLIGEDITLIWRPAPDLWPVKIDPSQVDQILANLCANARDAISGVGSLVIETGRTTVREADCAAFPDAAPGAYVVLTVSDDGAGIDEETLANLFEPFFTTKETGKGTGLGLATVYGIVKQNSGFIDVRSEAGSGTTFRIHLPRHAGAASPARDDVEREEVSPGRETVLLAEDEPAIRKLAARMLEGYGYSVLTAATPGEALRIAREHLGEIHLLLSDVVMPEMNGLELARTLRTLHPELKALFMSGYTADVIAHHGVLDDGVYFVQKPFTSRELVAKVRIALDRSQETSSH